MKQYIYTLSVLEIIHMKRSNEKNYSVDLSNPLSYSVTVKVKEEMDSNAFLYQAVRALDGDQENPEELLQSLVILDFSNVFVGDEEKKEWIAGREILDQGIYITFGQNQEEKDIHFVASEKSSSMAKKSCIYFVREDLRSALFERLMLGYKGSDKSFKIQTYASKIYAYRGLYLSDSVRITGPALNPETVIIIDDEKEIRIYDEKKGEIIPKKFVEKNQKRISADKKGENSGKFIWELKEKENDLAISPFDGEGLISPEYAAIINEKMGLERASSFQVRLPFGKGMLHTVNWESLFRDQLQKYAPELVYEEIEVLDIYDKPRNLSKARIILTKSMFKCAKWWKEYCKDVEQEDQIAFYFEQFHKYDHALYISGTNSTYRNTAKTIINYQFLNPMALNGEDMKGLLDKHVKPLREMSNNPMSLFDMDHDQGEESETGEENISEEKTVFEKAIRQNRAVIKDPYILGQLSDYQMTRLKDIYKGRIMCDGQLRFLSGDLLALAAVILARSTDEKLIMVVSKIWEQRLNKWDFFLPASKLKLEHKRWYAFLRNPHLSRYEESLLKIKNRNNKDEEDLYMKYFGDLEGLVMVATNSTVPATISGADFDGDIVRIVSEPVIVKAIERGIRMEKKDRKYERNLPFIDIPAPNSSQSPIVEKIDPGVIEKTFANQVGLISNMAVRYGAIEYEQDACDSQAIFRIRQDEEADSYKKVEIGDSESLCAEGCILVGLEIDANKNGAHPDLSVYMDARNDLKNYRKQMKMPKDDYLDYLKKFNEEEKLEGLKFNKQDDHFFVTPQMGRSYKISEASSAQKLERLPYQFLEAYDSLRPAAKGNGRRSFSLSPEFMKEIEGQKIFKFEEEEKQAFDQNIADELKKIYRAYARVNAEASRRSRLRKDFEKSNYYGRLRTILLMQYGKNLMNPLGGADGQPIELVMLEALGQIRDYCDQKDVSYETFAKRVIKNQWMYTPESLREAVLREEIFDHSFELDRDVVRLLSNFDCGGYKLLYYGAKDIYLSEKKDAVPEKYKDQEAEADESYAKKYMRLYYQCFEEKTDSSSFRRKLNEACRRDIFALFGKESRGADQAISYYSGLRAAEKGRIDQDGRFFWNIFTWEEISQSMIRQEETDNA